MVAGRWVIEDRRHPVAGHVGRRFTQAMQAIWR
jgi:hypothetical protein